MALTQLIFREQLPSIVAEELDFQLASIGGFLYTEHNDDGTHADVTADSVTVEEGPVVADRVVTDTIKLPRTMQGVGTADPITDPLFRLMDQAEVPVIDLAVTAGVLNYELQVSKPLGLLGPLRLAAQSTYAVSGGGDTDALAAVAASPLYSYYQLTAAGNRTINGIHTNDLTLGNRGQVLVLANVSSNGITFDSAGVVTNARKIIGRATVGPGGTIVLVYDNVDLAWRIVACNPGGWVSYTPVVSGNGGGAFTLGTGGTALGSYQLVGKTVFFQVVITLGTGFSWPGGQAIVVTHPSSKNGSFPTVWGNVFMSTAAGAFAGILLSASATQVLLFHDIAATAGGQDAVYANAPVVFVAGDAFYINGQYEE